jgi:hypothetical protein
MNTTCTLKSMLAAALLGSGVAAAAIGLGAGTAEANPWYGVRHGFGNVAPFCLGWHRPAATAGGAGPWTLRASVHVLGTP